MNCDLVPPEDRRDEEQQYHLMSLSELQVKAPFINWRDHFVDAFSMVKRKITDAEKVVVYAPEYLEKLTAIVKEYNSTNEGKM